MSDEPRLSVYTDGASRGNPGPAAIAYAIFDPVGQVIEKDAKVIGIHTNNEAEYEALLWGLEKVRERSCGSIRAYSDSELVVRQFKGIYKARDRDMAINLEKLKASASLFGSFELMHLLRGHPRIQVVDTLVNQALDNR